MATKNPIKTLHNFSCSTCSFICCNKKDYIRHLATAKHEFQQNQHEKPQKTPKNPNTEISNKNNCLCGKTYKDRSGLWRHKKICELINNQTIVTEEKIREPNDNHIIISLIAQNKELMTLLQEQSKVIKDLTPKIGTNNTTNNTTHNTQFNLQVFLNEDCKDAMNFSDFIKQIQVSLTDLENQAENGYIKGITKIFIENLKGLGMNNRPIHCTDKKRRTLYIKENNEWDKEGSQDILKKGIQEVTRRTFEQLIKEQEIHSDEYDDADSEFSMKCISIQRNLTPNHPRESTISKVIDNITQNTGILEKI